MKTSDPRSFNRILSDTVLRLVAESETQQPVDVKDLLEVAGQLDRLRVKLGDGAPSTLDAPELLRFPPRPAA